MVIARCSVRDRCNQNDRQHFVGNIIATIHVCRHGSPNVQGRGHFLLVPETLAPQHNWSSLKYIIVRNTTSENTFWSEHTRYNCFSRWPMITSITPLGIQYCLSLFSSQDYLSFSFPITHFSWLFSFYYMWKFCERLLWLHIIYLLQLTLVLYIIFNCRRSFQDIKKYIESFTALFMCL